MGSLQIWEQRIASTTFALRSASSLLGLTLREKKAAQTMPPRLSSGSRNTAKSLATSLKRFALTSRLVLPVQPAECAAVEHDWRHVVMDGDFFNAQNDDGVVPRRH